MELYYIIGYQMETNRLKQFCTVVDTGNLRKASDLLGISHSGLFKSLKVLEEELGYALFIPSGRGIVPSDQAKLLYERSNRFFSELDILFGKSEAPSPSLVRIGSFEVFTTYFTGKLLKDYLPKAKVEVHELVPGKLEEALILNQIDLGITYEPVPRSGITYSKISKISMGAYAVKGAFHDQGIQDSILEIPFAVPANPLEGVPSGVKGLDAWPEGRFKRKVTYKVDLMTTGLELVRQGLCAIFIPRFVAHLYNESVNSAYRLQSLSLPHEIKLIYRDVFLVKRESTIEDDTFKTVAKALHELCTKN